MTPVRTRFARFALVALPLFALTGCLGPHKVNKWVATHYSETPAPAFSKPISGIKISSPLINQDAALSSTTKKTKLLPLILFWKWNVDNHCTLNAGIPLGFFAQGLASEAKAISLKDKLAGRTVEVEVKQIPRLINVNDNGWLAFVLLYYVGGESISVGPEDGELTVNWRFVDNGVPGIWEHFNMTQDARPLFVKYFQSTRKTSGKSLKAYDERMSRLGGQLADDMAQTLDRASRSSLSSTR